MSSNKIDGHQILQNASVEMSLNGAGQDEVTAIILTFKELGEWLQEIQGSAQEAIKNQVEKFKRKIKEFKKLNNSHSPVVKS